MNAPAECLVCGEQTDAATAEAEGWQRGACTCTHALPCPTGAVWLCPQDRTDAPAGAREAA